MQRYNKAIAAFVGGLIALLASMGILPAEWQTPEAVATITGLVMTFLVWRVPNKPDTSSDPGGTGGVSVP